MSLSVTRIDYISYARQVSNSPCYKDLYRIYTSANFTSWLDLCLYPAPTSTAAVDYGNLWSMGSGTEYCLNCPTGPFLDYSFLGGSYDDSVFDLPCKMGAGGTVQVIGNTYKTALPVAAKTCYVSLGFAYDPKYLFDVQFPGFYDNAP